jgi:hypothetical protein
MTARVASKQNPSLKLGDMVRLLNVSEGLPWQYRFLMQPALSRTIGASARGAWAFFGTVGAITDTVLIPPVARTRRSVGTSFYWPIRPFSSRDPGSSQVRNSKKSDQCVLGAHTFRRLPLARFGGPSSLSISSRNTESADRERYRLDAGVRELAHRVGADTSSARPRAGLDPVHGADRF